MADFSREAVRRRDPKEQKRQKNARLQKQNWAALDPGELQEKEDQETDFGIRNYNANTLEKEKSAGDIWFGSKQERGSPKPGSSPRAPGNRSRDASPNASHGSAAAEDKDVDSSASKPGGRESEPSTSALGGKDLKLNTLIRPEQSQGVALNELLGGRSTAGNIEDEKAQSREALGLRSLNQSSVSSASVLGQGFGLSRDPGQRPALAAPPTQAEGAGSRGSLFSQPGPGSAGGPSRNAFSSSAASSPSGSFQNPGFGSPQSGFGAPPQSDLSGRSVRDTFGLPARPGLGAR